MIQVLCLNAVWYKPDFILDLSPDEESTKFLQKTLIYSIRCLLIDNAEIFEIGTQKITPCCDKMIPGGHTIFKPVTHTYVQILHFCRIRDGGGAVIFGGKK